MGSWIWVSDHKALNYSDFNPGQPDNADGNGNCLRMSGLHDFRWEAADCAESAFFICEMK